MTLLRSLKELLDFLFLFLLKLCKSHCFLIKTQFHIGNILYDHNNIGGLFIFNELSKYICSVLYHQKKRWPNGTQSEFESLQSSSDISLSLALTSQKLLSSGLWDEPPAWTQWATEVPLWVSPTQGQSSSTEQVDPVGWEGWKAEITSSHTAAPVSPTHLEEETYRKYMLFSHSVLSDSLRPHELQHTRLPCPSLSPGAHSNSCPSSRWCHPTISPSVTPFSSCPHSFPASGSFPMSRPNYWSFILSISPSNEYSGLISFRTDWFDLLVVQGTLMITKTCTLTEGFLGFTVRNTTFDIMTKYMHPQKYGWNKRLMKQ